MMDDRSTHQETTPRATTGGIRGIETTTPRATRGTGRAVDDDDTEGHRRHRPKARRRRHRGPRRFQAVDDDDTEGHGACPQATTTTTPRATAASAEGHRRRRHRGPPGFQADLGDPLVVDHETDAALAALVAAARRSDVARRSPETSRRGCSRASSTRRSSSSMPRRHRSPSSSRTPIGSSSASPPASGAGAIGLTVPPTQGIAGFVYSTGPGAGAVGCRERPALQPRRGRADGLRAALDRRRPARRRARHGRRAPGAGQAQLADVLAPRHGAVGRLRCAGHRRDRRGAGSSATPTGCWAPCWRRSRPTSTRSPLSGSCPRRPPRARPRRRGAVLAAGRPGLASPWLSDREPRFWRTSSPCVATHAKRTRTTAATGGDRAAPGLVRASSPPRVELSPRWLRVRGVTREWAWGGATGAGVRVAIIDSASRTRHPCFAAASWRTSTVELRDDGPRVVPDEPRATCSGTARHAAGSSSGLAPRWSSISIRVLGSDLRGKERRSPRGSSGPSSRASRSATSACRRRASPSSRSSTSSPIAPTSAAWRSSAPRTTCRPELPVALLVGLLGGRARGAGSVADLLQPGAAGRVRRLGRRRADRVEGRWLDGRDREQLRRAARGRASGADPVEASRPQPVRGQVDPGERRRQPGRRHPWRHRARPPGESPPNLRRAPPPQPRAGTAPGRRVRVGHRRLALPRGDPCRGLRRGQLAGPARDRRSRADPALRAPVGPRRGRCGPVRSARGPARHRSGARGHHAGPRRGGGPRRIDPRDRGALDPRRLLLDLLRSGDRRPPADARGRAGPRSSEQRLGDPRQPRVHHRPRAGRHPPRLGRARAGLPAERHLLRRRRARPLAPARAGPPRRPSPRTGTTARPMPAAGGTSSGRSPGPSCWTRRRASSVAGSAS